jgi:hypothetical protein
VSDRIFGSVKQDFDRVGKQSFSCHSMSKSCYLLLDRKSTDQNRKPTDFNRLENIKNIFIDRKIIFLEECTLLLCGSDLCGKQQTALSSHHSPPHPSPPLPSPPHPIRPHQMPRVSAMNDGVYKYNRHNNDADRNMK